MKAYRTYGKLYLELDLNKGSLNYNSNFFSIKNEKRFGSFKIKKDNLFLREAKDLVVRVNKISNALKKGKSSLKSVYPSSAHEMSVYLDGKLISRQSPFFKKFKSLVMRAMKLKTKEIKVIELKNDLIFVKKKNKIKKMKLDKKKCTESICLLKKLGIIFL